MTAIKAAGRRARDACAVADRPGGAMTHTDLIRNIRCGGCATTIRRKLGEAGFEVLDARCEDHAVVIAEAGPARIAAGASIPSEPGQPSFARKPIQATTSLEPVAGTVAHAAMPATLAEYLNLADRTGRIARPDKRGGVAGAATQVLLSRRESVPKRVRRYKQLPDCALRLES
jgi:hypothetical protein